MDARAGDTLGRRCPPDAAVHGQGASQSIEDAFVLARCLAADRDDPQRGIEEFSAVAGSAPPPSGGVARCQPGGAGDMAEVKRGTHDWQLAEAPV